MSDMTFEEAKRRLEALGCEDVQLRSVEGEDGIQRLAITYNDPNGMPYGIATKDSKPILRLFNALELDKLHRLSEPLVMAGCEARGLECKGQKCGMCDEHSYACRWLVNGGLVDVFKLKNPTLESIPVYIEQRLDEIVEAMQDE